MKPLGLGRYGVQFTIGESAHDKLRYVQQLVGHEIAPREIALVFERALEAYIRELEKRRFAATDTPRPRHGRSSENPRYVPFDVKRAVWKRDQGQCTFGAEFMRHKRIAAAGARATADTARRPPVERPQRDARPAPA